MLPQVREPLFQCKQCCGDLIGIGVGDIAATIKKEAIGHGADALIIGRGILHETLGRLRAHSYQIIRTAPCPVISV